ncbi:MAG: hypothetical protein M3436_09725 [Pseudomonadota bacterium]|nr:hypothetical protein [Pseudomonadota bacterium]
MKKGIDIRWTGLLSSVAVVVFAASPADAVVVVGCNNGWEVRFEGSVATLGWLKKKNLVSPEEYDQNVRKS